MLKDIKQSGQTRIMLDCSTNIILDVLSQAQQVGIMTAYHSYILTSLVKDSKSAFTTCVFLSPVVHQMLLSAVSVFFTFYSLVSTIPKDLHMVELESFSHGGTNITALRLVDPDLEEVQNVVQDWVLGEIRFGRKIPFQGKTIKVGQTTFLKDVLQKTTQNMNRTMRCTANTLKKVLRIKNV